MSENITEITIGELMQLNKLYGITVEINDGQIVDANICERSTENCTGGR